jgi:enoyl-CoA hydratase
MTFDNLLLEHDGPVATLTINRPNVLNALDTPTTDELRRAILHLKHEPSVRVVIITGAGEKAFIAGADINELAALKPTQGKEHAQRGQHVLDLIENMGKPVIAAINGFCLGGGCELAMACTLRIAADTARIGQPEINLGIIPGYAGSQRLARLVGKGIALDLLLTGRQIKADEALTIGLVNRVVPVADIMTAATSVNTPASQPQVAGAAPLTQCCGPVCFGTPSSSSRTPLRFSHVRPGSIQRPIFRPAPRFARGPQIRGPQRRHDRQLDENGYGGGRGCLRRHQRRPQSAASRRRLRRRHDL